MIGVLCKVSERETAQEYFELFKTPWEFFKEGRKYEIVVSTLSDTPALHARLVILYSSNPTEFDKQKGLCLEPAATNQLTMDNEMGLPIYGKLTNIRGKGRHLIQDKSKNETYALGFSSLQREILRVGYDLFQEIAFLLSDGQAIAYAPIPTLEFHISLLRSWIVNSGIPLAEIPPIPLNHKFIVCLTHDVDFGGIRQHKFDHTMWGFVNRALVGSFFGFFKGTCSFFRLMKNWIAVLSLPLIYAGIIKDFWVNFEKYIEIEKDFSSTFFLIPFKNRTGEKIKGRFSAWRATRYDIDDVREQLKNLIHQGFEIGLHGIDAWHDVDKGKEEMSRIVKATGQERIGVRMHWLCFDRHSPKILDRVGFDYDSTFGYNEAIGYRAGTTQVFRPQGVSRLLELPLHIQDITLFYPKRMGLTSAKAWNLCNTVLNIAARFGGVVTVLWHERSLVSDRFWDKFYIRLLQEFRSQGAWFGTASQVVLWFRQRRSVIFEDCIFIGNTMRLRLRYEGTCSEPRMILRVHRLVKDGDVQSSTQPSYIDLPYAGESTVDIPI